MRSPFYQANFCAECGNPLEPRPGRLGFKPRYFCDDCAARLKQRSFVTPLAGVLLAASLAIFAFSYKQGGQSPGSDRGSKTPIQQLNSIAPVSAQDSIVNTKAKSPSEAGSRVLCGARTRRGTPCRHLVQPGERCVQHRGMTSMLDSAKSFPPSNGRIKSPQD
jgi:hypothetical protein